MTFKGVIVLLPYIAVVRQDLKILMFPETQPIHQCTEVGRWNIFLMTLGTFGIQILVIL